MPHRAPASVVQRLDGIRPGSRFRIEFDIYSEDDMRAVRAVVNQAVEDAVWSVQRQFGLIRGAEDLNPSWVRMIARHGARLALGVQVGRDREPSDR